MLYYFFRLLLNLGLLRLFWLLKLRLVEFTPLELSLPHKTLSANPLSIVIRTLSSVLEVHESLKRNYPCPFFITISSTKVKHILKSPDLEASRNHILFFAQVTFISLDLSEVNELDKFLEITMSKDQDIVHSEHHPSLPPLLQEFCPFVNRSFSNLVVSQLAFNYFGVH